jgi:rhodanese-related sulfurtransferase
MNAAFVNFVTVVVIGFAGCLGAASAQTANIYQATLAETGAKTPEVSTEEVRKIIFDGSAILVDTRTRAEFVAGHLPGARLLEGPSSDHVEIVERVVGGDKARAVVLYCNGPFCQASRRLGDQLAAAGFTKVRRYQLGIPVWRALGGPVQVELDGIARIFNRDMTAVYFDARPTAEFQKGTIPGAVNFPVDNPAAKASMPEDDFNRRIILFGQDGAQARKLADILSKRPWHNVSYYGGSYEELANELKDK